MNNIDIKSFIIGLLSSICLLLFFGHSKTIPDEIKCRSLVVINQDGDEMVWIGASDANSGYIQTVNEDGVVNTKITNGNMWNYNVFGTVTSFVGQSKDGDGMITTSNKYDSRTTYIGSNQSSAGLIAVQGKTGNRTASIYSTDGSGALSIKNNLNKEIVYLGASESNQGMIELRVEDGESTHISATNGTLRTYHNGIPSGYFGTSQSGNGLIVLSEKNRNGLFINPNELSIQHNDEIEALVLGGGYMFMNNAEGNNYAYLGYNKNTYNGMFAIYDNRGELIFGK
tara:strand:+ start:6787 stop:7638 length:852 start_codon:yes stop_codon:yes gene_type:complete